MSCEVRYSSEKVTASSGVVCCARNAVRICAANMFCSASSSIQASVSKECRGFRTFATTILICLASLQAVGLEDMSVIQHSSAAHRRLERFHRYTSPGQTGQIVTIWFEADPAPVAQLLIDSFKPTLRLDPVLSTLQPRSMLNCGTLFATGVSSCEASTRIEI